jgi:enediyne biosynthesis protein E4
MVKIISAIAILFLLLNVPDADTPSPTFTDVTKEANIDFVHCFGDKVISSILEATGSGCAFLDYDQDGFIDLFVVSGGYLEGISDPESTCKDKKPTDRLFRNRGDGTFEDVTEKAGVGGTGYGMGAAVGDYNNNGYPDIFVTNYEKNILYRNNGDGTFTDVTEQAGVGKSLWSVGAVWFDYDRDGYLDLFVGNYLDFDPEYRLYYEADVYPGPLAYPGQPDFLYRNNGDGTFTNVSEKAGITKIGRAMGVLAADYNDDGWPDIFVANDAMENYLYRNKGDGTFEEVALESGVAFGQHGNSAASMGGDFGDFDGDGKLDLLVPDMTFNALYKNLGDGLFDDVSGSIGVGAASAQFWSWGGDFLDYDNDGRLDILIVNGDGHRLSEKQEHLLMRNTLVNGQRIFVDASRQAGEYFDIPTVARGLCVGDYDNDGDLDFFVLNIDGPSNLLRNDGGNRNNWLNIRLVGTKSNRDGVGARVVVRSGDLVQTEEKQSASSYLSQNDPRLHFGFGKRDKIDEIVIRWPSGIIQKLTDVKVNQFLTVVEQVEQ